MVRCKQARPSLAQKYRRIPHVGFGNHAATDARGGGKGTLRAVYARTAHRAGACSVHGRKTFEVVGRAGLLQPCRNLHSAAKEIAALGEFPSDHEKIRKLKGVGAYTAGAIASIAFEQPTPAVDGNVIRVLSRLLADERGQDVLKDVFEKELAPAYPPARRGDFTQSLMELGATICLPSSPRCMLCPLFSLCGTRGDALPVRKRKAERKKTEMTVFVFSAKTARGFSSRTDGVLKGLCNSIT